MQAYLRTSRFFRGLFRIAKYAFLTLLGFAVAALLLLQLPAAQNWVAQQVVHSLEKQLGTEVSLGKAGVTFFNSVQLRDFYIGDESGDTLLFAERFKIGFSFFDLLRSEANIKSINATGAIVSASRGPSGRFNFSFINEAFASEGGGGPEGQWTVNLKEVTLTNSTLRLHDDLAEQDLGLHLRKVTTQFNTFSLSQRRIGIDNVFIVSPQLSVSQRPTGRQGEGRETPTEESPRLNPDDWEVALGFLAISDGDLRLHKAGYTSSIHGQVDFMDLHLDNIAVAITNGEIAADTVVARLNHIGFAERSGLILEQLRGDLRFTPTGSSIEDFYLATAHSVLQDNLALRYNDLRALGDPLNKVRLEFNANESVLSTTDLAKLVRGSPYVAGRDIRLSGAVSGRIGGLKGKDLSIEYGDYTTFLGNVYTSGLPNIDETFIELTIDELLTTRQEITQLVPMLRLPAKAAKLGRMRFEGQFLGFTKDFVAFGSLNTALGTVTSDVNMKVNQAGVPSYVGHIYMSAFDIGNWLDEAPMLGKVSLDVDVDGSGFSADDVKLNVTGKVDRITFNEYTYQNMDVVGELQQRFFSGQLYIKDPNLSSNFQGTVNFKERIPVFDVGASITHANLQGLNFSKDYYTVKTRVDFDFAGIDPDSINGTALFIKPVIRTNDDVYNLDTVSVISRSSQLDRELSVRSELADVSISGKYGLADLPVAVMQFAGNYLPLATDSVGAIPEQSVHINADIKKDHKLIQLLDTDIGPLSGLQITGHFSNAGTGAINMVAEVPRVRFGDVVLSESTVRATTEQDGVSLTAFTAQAQLGEDVSSTNNQLVALFKGNNVDFTFEAGSGSLINKVNISGSGERIQDSLVLQFTNSKLRLSEQEWLLNASHEVVIWPGNMAVRNLVATNANQALAFNSSQDGRHMRISTSSIALGKLLQLFQYDDYQIAGEIEGGIVVENYRSGQQLYVKADLVGANLVFEGHDLGTLDFSGAYDMLDNTLFLDSEMKSDISSIVATGFYSHSGPRETVRLKFNVDSTPVKLFEPFLRNLFSNMDGTLSGEFTFSGRPDDMNTEGFALLRNGGFEVDLMGTEYSFDSLRINFDQHEIAIDSGILRDRFDKKAVVTGGFALKSFQDFRFDALVVEGEPGLLMMDTDAEQSPSFYGTAYVDETFVALDGPLNDIEMLVYARSAKGTHISIPLSSSSGYSRKNFVTFRTAVAEEQELYEAYVSPVTLSILMDLTPAAEVEIIFDEQAGDIIKGRGDGSLVLELSKTGSIDMFGSYEIIEGDYTFTLRDIVNKPFTIDPGSRIQFGGDVYDAQMRVTAAYPTKAVPYDLLQDVADRLLDQEIKDLKRSVEIEVLLTLSGSLSAPQVAFDLRPVGTVPASFQAKLQEIRGDTTEVNKQAFALIVFNQFVPSSFAGEQSATALNVGSGVSSTVTEFLTNQLSRYFSDWLSRYNAELDFDYTTYSASDQTDPEKSYSRNELDFAFRKKLGKLTFNVGGSFEFGAQSDGLPQSNTFAGDFEVEYNLTEDGRARFVAFRRSDYDAFSTSAGGTVYKTGLGVFYRKDFDRWNEFLRE